MRRKIGRVLAHFGQQQTLFSRAFECMSIRRDSKTKYLASFDANELGRVAPIVVASFLNPRPSASQPVEEVSTINTIQSSGNRVQQNTGALSCLLWNLELIILHKVRFSITKVTSYGEFTKM